MPGRSLAELLRGDLRQHHRGQRVLLEQRGSGVRESRPHVGHDRLRFSVDGGRAACRNPAPPMVLAGVSDDLDVG
jgi:hypothetical protein